MALINCAECGKEISDKATACPNCGYPLATASSIGVVKIKLPRTEQISGGWVGLFSAKDAFISTNNRILWEGHHGQTASFIIDKPLNITINLGTWGNPIEGMIFPGKKYELIQDYGFHMKATFTLSEVDIIDSGR